MGVGVGGWAERVGFYPYNKKKRGGGGKEILAMLEGGGGAGFRVILTQALEVLAMLKRG